MLKLPSAAVLVLSAPTVTVALAMGEEVSLLKTKPLIVPTGGGTTTGGGVAGVASVPPPPPQALSANKLVKVKPANRRRAKLLLI